MMQINVYPESQKIRVRGPILRDEELRDAASRVARKICTVTDMEYNPKTASVLIHYEDSSLNQDKLKSLFPLARKLNAKASSYDESKKADILALIGEIEKKVSSW